MGLPTSEHQQPNVKQKLAQFLTSRHNLQSLSILMTPLVVFYVTGARSIEPINGQDGYAYVGVVARTQDFLERFPDSYFGTRFGYVIPSDLFRWMFGFEVGHHILRFGLLAILVHVMRMRGQVRFPGAIIAAVLFCMSPIVLVSTFSTYPMSVGALALLGGALSLATGDQPERSPYLAPFIASAILAIAWNSHLQLLIPSIVIFGVVVLDRAISGDGKGIGNLMKYAIAGLMGALATCSVGVIVLGSRYGVWNPWSPALRFAAADSDPIFKTVGFDWLTWRHYVLLLPVSVVLGTAVWVTERELRLRTAMRRLTLITIVLTLNYSFYQWVMKNIAFETFFHSSGLFVVSTCLFATSIGVLINRSIDHRYLLGLVVTVSSVISYRLGAEHGGQFWVLAIVTTAVCVIVFKAVRAQKMVQIALISTSVITSWTIVSSPHDFPATAGGYRTDPLYDQALFSFDKGSMNRASVVDKISSAIPSATEHPGDLRVWFEPTSPYDQLSGPFLWYRSSLQSPSDPPLPTVTQTIKENISTQSVRFIAIISGNGRAVDAGAQEIMKLSPQYNLHWKREFQDGDFSATVAMLELDPG